MLNSIVGLLSAGGGAANSYESIETVTVGSGGQSSISFTVIPSTYKHLQIRGISQTNRASYGIDDIKIQFNSDTASNYSQHVLAGDGSTASAQSGASTSYILGYRNTGTNTSGTWWGASVIDILDYTSTSKNKTVRILGGNDNNGTSIGGGVYSSISLSSGLWFKTPEAITTVTIAPANGTLFNQYSSFALYGIKG